jgi:hypothetical protein
VAATAAGSNGNGSGSATATPSPTATPQPALVAGLRDDLQGTATQDPDGALRVTLDDRTNPVLHLVVVVQSDQTATLTVTRSGATVCSVPARVGEGVAAICAGIEVRLDLQQTDGGGVVGRMTTRTAGQ